MNFVIRRNNERAPGFGIPEEIAELFENQLRCKTGGEAKHGVRWEHQGIGALFLEKISNHGCTLYILPTSGNREWKNLVNLKAIIAGSGLHHLNNQVQCSEDNKHLRVTNVKWDDLKILAPKLVSWVYSSETGKSISD